MSDTILGGDVTIAYFDENRQKRIYWTGGASTTYSANQLYSALMDHFDEPLRMDNPSPMSAQTPVEYTTGIIDTGDNDPWFLSYDLMEHITGGAIRTNLWTRTVTSATGIVVVPVTAAGNTIVAADAGNDISHADGDAGTLLEVLSDGGTTDYLIVRPDSSAAANNFDSTSGTLTCNANTGTQAAASTTGEQIWANTYTIGTFEPDTHVYFYQGDAADSTKSRVYSVNDNTQDYWGDGLIDVCIPIRDYKSATNPVIDEGYITGFARKYSTEFSYFEAATSTTSGGRNPIPLGTKDDLNNDTGIRTVTLSGSADNFNAGDEVQGATSGSRAIITATSGANPTLTLVYYLVGDPLTDFNGSEAINNQDDTGTSTGSGAPADAGPATTGFYTGGALPTISFTASTADIDDDATDEFYGITIDCNQARLSEVYEFLKYITRRGETGTASTDGIEGEQYIGADYYLAYSGTVSGGTIDEGEDVVQAVTGAAGTVISHDTTNKVLLLRNSRGTFDTSNAITSQDAGAGSLTPNTAASSFAPNAVSPFGTFAGGTFFGARGVLLTDYNSLDENAFQLTDASGATKQRPTAISLTVSNLVGTDETTTTDDRVAIFRLTGSGGDIDKTEYSATGGEAIGDSTITVDTAIAQDVPGKTTGGVLRLRDASDNYKDYRIRYSSWTGSVFTLANVVPANLTTGTNTTTLVSTTDELDNVKRGDLVLNVTQSNAVSYVSSVNAATNTVTIFPAITGQSSTDTIEINAVPVVVNTLDDVYVPLMDRYAAAASESVSLTYSSQIFFRVVARNSENATKIIPFTTDDTTTGTDRSNSVVRNEDTIIT